MAKGGLTEDLRTRVDRDLKAATIAVARNEDRSEGAVIRAALRAYAPIRSYLAKGKR
jgi:hypothetical protein